MAPCALRAAVKRSAAGASDSSSIRSAEVSVAWRVTRSLTSSTASSQRPTSASAAVTRSVADFHSPVGRPVAVKYFRYSSSIRSISNDSSPDGPASVSPAAASRARASESEPDRFTASVDADCSTRWASQSLVSSVSDSIDCTRSWASSPESCSRLGSMISSSVTVFLWNRLRYTKR